MAPSASTPPAWAAAALTLLLLAASPSLIAAVAPSGGYVIPGYQPKDCVDPTQPIPAAGLFPASMITSNPIPSSTVQVVTAKLFNVSYFNTYKVINVASETYVLYQCGTASPAASLFPSGAKFFKIPLQSVSASDTTVVGFLEALNVLDRVAFVTNLVDQPCMQALSGGDCNQVQQGYGSTQSPSNQDLTGYGVSALFGSKNASNPLAVAFSATSDPGPLNRAEWLKFVAPFFNKEPEANKQYNTISQAYTAIAAAATANAPATPKVVAWIQWSSAEYTPCTNPEGAISFNYPAYKAAFTKDAGARILNQADLQPFIDAKQLLTLYGAWYLCANQSSVLRSILALADVVVDEGRYFYNSTYGTPDDQININTFLTQYGLSTADVSNLKFYTSNSLLREDGQTNPTSYNQWFERAIARPDQVLADLLSVVNPQALQLGSLGSALSNAGVQISQPFFLRNLAKKQAAVVLSPSMCNSVVGCRYSPSIICPFVYTACNGTTVYSSDSQRCAPACNIQPSPSPSPSQAFAAARPLSLAALGAMFLAMFLLV